MKAGNGQIREPSRRRPDSPGLVLDVEGVSKKFCRELQRSLYYGVLDMASELVRGRRASERLRAQEFWALQDVSFQLRQGEALAIVGRNGSGKTTTLRIIAGVIRPDTGVVRTRGRVAPLIALGAGFNPVLTGRENVFANMAILGLSTQEIRAKLDAVVDFAEIGSAIDAPLQTYSSGMAARLGFACAIHVDPDLLLVDEVLAVGDMSFRAKCYRRLAELRRAGAGIILVSHSPHMVVSVCDRAVYLSEGRVLAIGEAADVVTRYEADLLRSEPLVVSGSTAAAALVRPPKTPENSAGLDIVSVHFEDAHGNRLPVLRTGEPVTLCVRCWCHRSVGPVGLGVFFRETLGEGDLFLSLNSEADGQSFAFSPGECEVRLSLPFCGLRPGTYTMKLYFVEPPLHLFDVVEALYVKVESARPMRDCRYYQPRSWHLKQVAAEHFDPLLTR
jgi:homopolymeric O-antigen transport system ATP-binding protein